ncbi:MAG: hypothetical protein P1V97_03230 [Planctomycetota bacterium]|nr:hypothetical protein [Planctomycetota bacterium]
MSTEEKTIIGEGFCRNCRMQVKITEDKKKKPICARCECPRVDA